MARIQGKLTAKGMGWDRSAIGEAVKKVPADGGRVLIGRIAGIVSGLHQTVNEDTGDVQTGLKGTFRGVSSKFEQRQDGDKKDGNGAPIMIDTDQRITITAGRCYLPSGLQEMVEAAYQEATKGEGNARNTVSFALDLYAKPDTNKAGYSYDGNTLVEAAEQDPLALLMDSAESAAKALPAPAAPVGDEAPAEKTPAKGK